MPRRRVTPGSRGDARSRVIFRALTGVAGDVDGHERLSPRARLQHARHFRDVVIRTPQADDAPPVADIADIDWSLVCRRAEYSADHARSRALFIYRAARCAGEATTCAR